ncbi:MAG: NADH-quinone oxidoreductase subunit I, partial [Deltaproteobacteria bacterium]|nr:NADH-quinone oxidoreductase subunit I [Deltaproteobacteria bacterium]
MPKRQEQIGLSDKVFLISAFKGVITLFLRFLRNLKEAFLIELGLKERSDKIATIQYPDQIQTYPLRYRGRHRLTLDDEGRIKCTSCFLCATACPARCIYIEPAEHPDGTVEKFPDRYEIDTLLCIYCGFCVEACPVDAIRMDTGIHPEIYPSNPNFFIE